MAVASAARNSPGQSMLGFAASVTASWASWRARWGSLGWLLNPRLHPLSSDPALAASGPQPPRRQEEWVASHLWANGWATPAGEGTRRLLGQPALEGT